MSRFPRLLGLVLVPLLAVPVITAISAPSDPLSDGTGVPAAAADAQADGMAIVSQIGAPVRRLATDGEWIYAVVGSRLATIDTGDPAQPRVVGWSVPFPRLPVDLTAENGYVHLAFERRGYQVVDATTPSDPRAVGYVEGRVSWPQDIAVSGSLAVISASGPSEARDQLGVYDIATPASPVALSDFSIADSWAQVRDLAIVGETVWLARDDGIGIIDLADPRHARTAGRLTWADWQLGGLAPEAPMAYVAGGPRPTPPSGGSGAAPDGKRQPRSTAGLAAAQTILRLLDVTTPGQTREVGQVETDALEAGRDVAVSGGTVYVAVDSRHVIRAFDVRTPDHVTTLGELKVHFSAGDLCMVGRDGQHVAFLTNNNVSLMDASDPHSPQLAGSLAFPTWEIRDVAALGGHAYLADDRFGLRIVDATDPARPRHVGDVSLASGRLAAVTVVDVDGGAGGQTRRLASGTAVNDGLVIFDVTDPTTPSILGAVDTPGAATDIAVVGNHAYVADGDNGLQIVDVSDPTVPRLAGSLVIPSTERPLPTARYVAAAGSYAYVVYKSGKILQVADVLDPDHPREVGRPAERIGNVEPAGVAAGDGYVYIVGASSGSASGLEVYDASAPTHPRQVGFLESRTDLDAIALAGQTAYIAGDVMDDKPVLQRVDISNPRRPRLVDSAEVPGSRFVLAAAGDLIFVADDDIRSSAGAGLTIVRVGPPGSPVPTPAATPVRAAPVFLPTLARAN